MRIFSIQCNPIPSGITDDGQIMTSMPYPFLANSGGRIAAQEIWKGHPLRIVGFVKDLKRQEVDLWWADMVVGNTDDAIGMYLITKNKDGTMGVHMTAVMHVKEVVNQR